MSDLCVNCGAEHDYKGLGVPHNCSPAPARVGLDFEAARTEAEEKFRQPLVALENAEARQLFKREIEAHLNAQCLALVAQARAEYAPLLAAVREWQEAVKAEAADWSDPSDESTAQWLDACGRVEKAAEALAALPLPEAP